jgi:hypothetical protein
MTYKAQPAKGGGFWVYDSGFRLLGYAPTLKQARYLIPREQTKLGVAKPERHDLGFGKYWHGWSWEGQLFPRGGVGGTRKGKLIVDMQTGEVYKIVRRTAKLELIEAGLR